MQASRQEKHLRKRCIQQRSQWSAAPMPITSPIIGVRFKITSVLLDCLSVDITFQCPGADLCHAGVLCETPDISLPELFEDDGTARRSRVCWAYAQRGQAGPIREFCTLRSCQCLK